MTGFITSHYRALGETGITVSPIGLGTVKFGRNTDVKYPTAFELPDDRTLVDLLAISRHLGINLIDTAPAYGTAEERIGKLLEQRADWIISTKVGEAYNDGVSTYDFSAAATVASVNRSLERLRTDYLDIVIVHSDGDDESIINHTDVIPTLLKLKESGKIRAVGVSTKTVAGGLLALRETDLVMAAYSLDDPHQLGVLDEAVSRHRGVLVKKGLSSGNTDNPLQSLQFVLQHPGVSSVVIGSINADHLRRNVAAAAPTTG